MPFARLKTRVTLCFSSCVASVTKTVLESKAGRATSLLAAPTGTKPEEPPSRGWQSGVKRSLAGVARLR